MIKEYAKRYLILCVGLFIMALGFVGIVLVAIGVSLEVLAGVVTLAGERLVLAICEVTQVKFGNMKVCFDVTLVVIAVAIGFFAYGELLGVREGTVAAAILVGLFAKQLGKLYAKLMTTGKGAENPNG